MIKVMIQGVNEEDQASVPLTGFSASEISPPSEPTLSDLRSNAVFLEKD